MAKIKWILGKKTKDGKYRVVIKISHHGERRKKSTGIFLESNEFVKNKNGEIKIKSDKKRIDVGNLIRSLEEKLYIIQSNHFGRDFTIDELVNILTQASTSDKIEIDFFEYTEKWMDRENIKGKKNYKSMLNSLEQYNKGRYLSFEKIDVKYLNGYLDFLKGKLRAQSLYLGAIRHIYKQAASEYNTDDKIILSPFLFERFKVPKQQVKGHRALSVDTLKRIINYKGSGRAELARDCFVLSFLLIGMNSADMYDSDAKIKDGFICYRRKKVRDRRFDNAYIEVQIHEFAKVLFDRYSDKERAFNFHKRFCDETGFNRAINIGLKQVEKDINKDILEYNDKYSANIPLIERLQFYQARHTWATIARNELQIDKYTIHECLNHIDSSTRIDDIYIKKNFCMINEANKMVIDYVLNL